MGYIYCMSDIHSDKESFLKMLEVIDFKEEDRLYILGNVFGYGPDSYGLYREIRKRVNVWPLMGDQEIRLYDSIMWHQNNPASPCHLQMTMRDEISGEELQRIAFWIHRMKFQDFVRWDGVKYLLAHVQTAADRDEKVPHYYIKGNLVSSSFHRDGVEGCVSVVGHFETNYLRRAMGEEPINPNLIWVNPKGNVYGIDCGNAMRGKMEGNRLGCLRLNDKKCFYV